MTEAARLLRITLIVGVFPALSETFVLDQVIYLLERGHNLRIVAFEARAEAAVHEEVARHGLLRRTRYLARPKSRLSKLRIIGAALRLAGGGFAKSALAMRRARHSDGEVGYLTTLAAAVVAFAEHDRPDVFLCHFGQNGSITLRAVEALGWSVPVVTIFHGFELTMLSKQRGPHLYRHLLKNGQMFLPVCDYFGKILVGMGAPEESIFVQRMGVDPEKFNDERSLSRPIEATSETPFIFLAIGRLVEKKGHAAMLRAFAKAFADVPSDRVHLRIVGDGPLEAELKAMAEAEGLAITLLGALRRDDVFDELRRADVFLQPSVTAPDGDTEGMPVSILEAMAFSKPIIATWHSGIPEVVSDGSTGILVDERDEQSLAEAMMWMRENTAAAREMGLAGRAKLEKSYGAKQWNDVLEQRLRSITRQ